MLYARIPNIKSDEALDIPSNKKLNLLINKWEVIYSDEAVYNLPNEKSNHKHHN